MMHGPLRPERTGRWQAIGRLLVSILALVLLVPHAWGQDGEHPRLRVLTYNIHHGRGMDGVFDYERLARIINELDPDLVALQEVDRGVQRSGRVDQAEILAGLTGMHHAFGNALYHQGGEYGEAILSRYPLREVKAHHLPFHPGLEPRTALAARVRPGNGLPEVIFVGTHLCHQQSDTRTEQTRRLNALFGGVDTPVILVGDLNARPGSDPMKVLLEGDWVDAIAPRSRIDYVLHRTRDPWHVAEVTILDEPVASDHQPVLAVLEWRGPRTEAAGDAGRTTPPEPGLVARFDFDDAAADQAFVDGLEGTALRIAPGSPHLPIAIDDLVTAPDRDFSVRFWLRTTAAPHSRFVVLSGKAYPDNSLASQKNAGWVFFVSNGTWAWNMGSGGRRITYERDNGEHMPLNDGRWHQLTMTYDSDAGVVRLFYDDRNAVTYNVRDSTGFDFTSAAELALGWSAPPHAAAPGVLPAVAEGADDLQALVDAFNDFGLPAVEADELERLVTAPERLFARKRDALDPTEHADLLQSLSVADLEPIERRTRQLLGNPYTVHQAPSFMEVAPLLRLYSLDGGTITIDEAAAESYAARERLDAPDFDIDELTVWDRVLAPEEVRAAYARHFTPTAATPANALPSLTACAWNIYHGGIHHRVEEHGWDSRDVIVDLIRREGIDIVMMQETYSAGDSIAAALGYTYATTIDWDYLNQGANISVLSRYPIEEIHVPPDATFMNVAARIRLSETQQVYAMSNWYGMRSFPNVFEYHQARFDDADRIPVLFGGDFNAVPHTDGGDSPASRRLLEDGFTDAYRSRHPDVSAHPGFSHRSERRIDQLYFKGAGLTNRSTTVLSTWPTQFPSDHYIIKAVFDLGDGTEAPE